MKTYKIIYILIVFGFGTLSSCTTLQEYDKIYLYDEDMQLYPSANETYEISIQSYREGASSTFGTKGGGGCGCY